MSSFIETVTLAVTSPNNDTRQANELKLIEYRQKESNQFLVDCMNHISDDKTDPSIKQAIATLVGVSFRSEMNQGEGFWWYKLEPNVRDEVKKVCLQNLISKNDIIKNAIADLISTIYVLDAPKNEWSSLVSNLAVNSRHENVDIQRSAALTLGYICEKLATNTIKPSEADIESIMTGVASGLMDEQKNDIIRLTAIKALQDAIPLFKDELQKENVREFFLTLILKNAAYSNIEISLKATQSLIDIFKSCYQYLSTKYMDVILERTLALMGHNATSIVIASTEFWNSVAQYELEQKEKIDAGERAVPYHGFIQTYGAKITTALLASLLKKDSEDDDSGMSVHTASLECLINVNSLASATNKDINIGFIGSQIGSDHDNGKVAALMCFEAMILGFNDDISSLIDSSFSNIIEFLKINATVCRAALKVIQAVSERYAAYMLHDKVVNTWLEFLITILHSDLKLASYVCTILANLGTSAFSKGIQQGEFIAKSLDICKALAEVAFSKGSNSSLFIINDCFVAIMSIAKSMPNIASSNALLEFCNNCLQNTQSMQKEMKLAIRDGLLTTLYTLRRQSATSNEVDKGVIGSLYQFAIQECNSQTEIFPNVLMVVVAISTVLKQEFDDSKVQEICGVASKALKNFQNEELMKAGLESVGDLLRNFPQAMSPHVAGLLEYILECLQNSSLSKELRVSILSTLGDIAIGCPREMKVRLQKILQIYCYAFEAVIHILNTENDNPNLEYADRMRTTLSESIHYLIVQLLSVEGMRDGQVEQQLADFAPMLALFVSKNMEDERFRISEHFILSSLLMFCQLSEAKLIKSGCFSQGLFQRYHVLINTLKSKRKTECAEALQYLSNSITSA